MVLNGCELRHDVGCSKSILVVKLEVGVSGVAPAGSSAFFSLIELQRHGSKVESR
jgi:hypothetical protein